MVDCFEAGYKRQRLKQRQTKTGHRAEMGNAKAIPGTLGRASLVWYACESVGAGFEETLRTLSFREVTQVSGLVVEGSGKIVDEMKHLIIHRWLPKQYSENCMIATTVQQLLRTETAITIRPKVYQDGCPEARFPRSH
jgi:hypothetical protein